MISNSFIPISIPHFQEYLLEKFNVNINEIPYEDWNGLIHNNYCKNIINNNFCLKKYKKTISNVENNDLMCSKCCERKV
jgi:hypothetical protein